MYGPQEQDRSLLGRQVWVQMQSGCDEEKATIVRTTVSGMIKVRMANGDFLWGNQWEDV